MKPNQTMKEILNDLQKYIVSKEDLAEAGLKKNLTFLQDKIKLLMDEKTAQESIKATIAELEDSLKNTSAISHVNSPETPVPKDSSINASSADPSRPKISSELNILLKNRFNLNLKEGVFSTFLLAACYEHGFGVERNLAMAVTLYQGLASKEFSFAQYALAKCYQDGRGIFKNNSFAADWLQKAALQGHFRAQYDLAYFYAVGFGVVEDPKRATELFALAAASGDPCAITDLAEQYSKGCGVEQDTKKAFELYQQAAELGNPVAQFNLANRYQNGIWVQQDDKRAFELYQLAAEQNHAAALNNVGIRYMYGKGVVKDESLALQFFQRAIAAGGQASALAATNLQILLTKGNQKAILHSLIVSASKRSYDCQRKLAIVYAGEGNGKDLLPKSIVRAILLTLHCLEITNDHAEALQARLQHLYNLANSDFHPKDFNHLINRYNHTIENFPLIAKEKVTHRDHLKMAHALDALGFCHQFGLGFKRDLKMAVNYYQRAIQHGLTTTHQHLWICYQHSYNLTQVHAVNKSTLYDSDYLNINNALAFFESASKTDLRILKSHIEAILITAEIYETGPYGFQANLQKAFQYYQKAFEVDATHPVALKKQASFKLWNNISEQIQGLHFGWENRYADGLSRGICSLIAEYAYDETLLALSHDSEKNQEKAVQKP